MADAPLPLYIVCYLAGAFVLLAWMAVIDRHELREAFWLSLLWPLTLVMIPIVTAFARMEQRGWYVHIEYRSDLSPFGFRTRVDAGTGWAVRCLRLELQVWKTKKVPRP